MLTNPRFRAWLNSLLVLVFIAWVIPAAAAMPNSRGAGVVDSFVLTPASDALSFTAAGWVGGEKPGSTTTALTVKLGGELVYEGPFETLDRPDVAAAMNRKDWSRSGWRVSEFIPLTLKDGVYDLSVHARISDGSLVDLALGRQIQKVVVNRTSAGFFKKAVMCIGLILAIGLFYTVLLHGDWLAEKISKRLGKTIAPVSIAIGLIVAVFAGLIAIGMTGSSLKLLYDQAPFIDSKTAHVALFQQPIRSDEWLVMTPLSIGQVNHQPAFPIINRNLGEDGQNMLVVGMAGVPVQHITLLAKPATWGFHLFDLKRALAWYWWFPLFGCLLALWWLFSLLIPGQWRLGLFLSLLFCLSPYLVAWSNWPAYAVFFPSIALCSSMLILRQKNRWWLAALGVLLGLSFAGFVLVLYPPWQVSLGCLYLAIAIGLVLRDRAEFRLDRAKIAAFFLASALAGLILWSWWIDAKPAIEVMLNTVYPGVRAFTGGGMPLPELLRGFTNIGSMYKQEGATSNQSEIASFYYLFLPLAAAAGFRLGGERRSLYLMLPIALFAVYALLYMMHGVPPIIARMTFWERVPPYRADLALGLSYVLLCGLMLSNAKFGALNDEKKKLLAYLVSLAWTAVVAYAISAHPKGELVGITPGVAAALLIAVFLSGFWLVIGDAKKFMAISLAMCAATTLPFHPLSFAPKKVEPLSDIGSMLVLSGNPASPYKRVLVLESQVPAMALMSVGIPTVNGVLYYPQVSLWRHLGVDKTKADVFNRYQHLLFSVGKPDAADGFVLDSPQGDVVRVTIDAERFDFGLTGAGLVLAPQGLSERLQQNQSIRFVRSNAAWSWFDVIDDRNEQPTGINKQARQ